MTPGLKVRRADGVESLPLLAVAPVELLSLLVVVDPHVLMISSTLS